MLVGRLNSLEAILKVRGIRKMPFKRTTCSNPSYARTKDHCDTSDVFWGRKITYCMCCLQPRTWWEWIEVYWHHRVLYGPLTPNWFKWGLCSWKKGTPCGCKISHLGGLTINLPSP